MNTSIIRPKEIWSDEDLYKTSLDGKLLYFYLLTSPDRGYLPVFKWRKRFACTYTGLNGDQIEVALESLVSKGFIELYEEYICILKSHVAAIGGPYGAINTDRELKQLPENIRSYYYPGDIVPESEPAPKKQNKTGPAPETIKQIIGRQPEALRVALTDFVEDRKERKKPPTTRAVKGWINKLEQLYPNDPKKQTESIMQSIERGWMGLFEVAETKMKPGQGAFL